MAKPKLVQRFIGYENREFGRWTVLRFLRRTKFDIWLCRCQCGTEREVRLETLVGGMSISCGCYKKEMATKRLTRHGRSGTPEYWVWAAMIQRCHNPNSVGYANYGARGIHVCDRWRSSFANFFADMGSRPSPKLQIDRKKNELGYEPGNCVWATQKENMGHRRNARLLTHNGVTQSVTRWGEQTGLGLHLILSRIDMMGWTVERALTQPRRKKKEMVT